MINMEMHKNLQVFKQEKDEFLKKSKEFEGKAKLMEEENLKIRKKNDELEIKVNELKEKLTKKTQEINFLRFEKKQEFDQSFKQEKENILKYEEFHQVFEIFSIKNKILSDDQRHGGKIGKPEKTLQRKKEKIEKEVKRLEIEKNMILAQRNEMENAIEDLKKKHLNILVCF